MPRQSAPTRTLRDRPDLDQLKRQAKELLERFRAGEPSAAEEVHTHYFKADPSTFALHDAQLVIARAHGFESWPKLKAYVNGVTVRRLVDAVRAGDLDTVRSMVAARPELVHLDVDAGDEHRAIHHAVLQRHPEIIRFLMQHGADAHKGIYPHRAATTAFTIASERGYDEIVAIIQEETSRRSGDAPLKTLPPQQAAALMDAFRCGDEDAMIATLDAHRSLIRLTDESGRTALHWAAACLWPKLMAWLLDQGADPQAKTKGGQTPLDVIGDEAGLWPAAEIPNLTKTIAKMLSARGAQQTARAAIVAGDAAWLRARHADGTLANYPDLVTCAVTVNRPDMLTLLLDLGLDPDERGRVDGMDEIVFSWGGPLRDAVRSGQIPLAEILLKRGANPNTNVYAASTAMLDAYEAKNWPMVQLLERHGGVVDAITAGYLGLTDRAKAMFDLEAAGRLPAGTLLPGRSLAETLLDTGASNAHVDIVTMALEHLDWPRGDGRWQWMLMRPLGHRPIDEQPRALACLRLILERSGADLPSHPAWTLLHDVAADWPRTPLDADERIAFTKLLLDMGARTDVRDDILKSTPLGWACRWGRVEMVKVLLARGVDPIEPDAETWATPIAWARKRGDAEIIALLTGSGIRLPDHRSLGEGG